MNLTKKLRRVSIIYITKKLNIYGLILGEIEVNYTEIPEDLLNQLPPKARKQIESRLRNLDEEIAEFTARHNKYSSLRTDLDERILKIKEELEKFEYNSQQEMMELQDYEDMELKKVRKERRDYEKYQKENKSSMTNKKGKQEIDELKSRILEIKNEIKAKDKKNHSASEVMKQELDFFTEENDSIQAEIRKMEKERIHMMRDRRQNSNKNSGNAPQVNDFQHTEADTSEIPQNTYHVKREYSEPSENSEQNDSNETEENFQMVFPEIYHNSDSKIINETVNKNGKIQRIFENGKKELIFNNGVKKQIFPDGYQIVYFNNKDIKQTYPDKKSVYYFSEANTTQTTFPNELKVFRFSNGQIEKHYPDQTKEVGLVWLRQF